MVIWNLWVYMRRELLEFKLFYSLSREVCCSENVIYF